MSVITEGDEQEKMSVSLGSGSEEAFEFVCKPCQRDNQYVEGVGYCVTCSEYLCATCFSCHKKSLVSRDHALLDKATMLQQTVPPPLPPKLKRPARPSGESDPHDPFTQQCPKHDLEFTKFHCNEHSSLACPVCIDMDHKLCEDVSYIPDISDGIMDSDELKDVFGELKTLKAVLKYEDQRESYNERNMDDIHKATIDDMLAFKDDVTQIIDNLCISAEKSAVALKDAQVASFTAWLKRYNGVNAKVDKNVREMERNMSRANCSELFISMKTVKAQISSLRDEVQLLSHQNKQTQYTFKGNHEIKERLANVASLGAIVKRNPDKVTAKLLHSINVKSDQDTRDCNITAAVVLPDGDIALSDHHNKSIKIVAPSQNKVTKQLVMESEPFDLAVFEDNKVAVALSKVHKIQLLQLTNTGLVKTSSFDTSNSCTGIEYHNEKLIAACEDPGCVIIFDMSGKVLQKIAKDGFGNALFIKPRSVALSMDKNVLYVTDPDMQKVMVMNFDGDILAEYRREDGQRPKRIALDSDGAVYVCFTGSHAIHRLSPTCRHLQVLLCDEDCIKFPFAIALDRNRDLLYVGSASKCQVTRNSVNVYKLENDWN